MTEEQPDYIKRINELPLERLDQEFNDISAIKNLSSKSDKTKRTSEFSSARELGVDKSIEIYVTYAVLNNDIPTAVANLKNLISKNLELEVREAIKNKIESLIDWPRLKNKDEIIVGIDNVDPEKRSDILSKLRDECIAEGIYGKESRDALKARELIDELVKDFLTSKYYDSVEKLNDILIRFRRRMNESPELKNILRKEIEKLIIEIDKKLSDDTLTESERSYYENRKYFLLEQLDN